MVWDWNFEVPSSLNLSGILFFYEQTRFFLCSWTGVAPRNFAIISKYRQWNHLGLVIKLLLPLCQPSGSKKSPVQKDAEGPFLCSRLCVYAL